MFNDLRSISALDRRAFQHLQMLRLSLKTMRTLSLANLKTMSAAQRSRRLADLVGAARAQPNGELPAVTARIQEFEQRAGFDSAEMQRRLASGDLAESDDVCVWLMLLDLREHLASLAPRSR